ncbi:NAD(P)/FAD-dependent oxidoreductase [Chthonobacter albigriseus]|uniref:NAD(P)/FAD-dependent oxidoreductase n=1 Tax=Chthonobacter albigriseus TaxID=1683161 RepID=UPI0015EF95F4|nr:FAD-binding protein [Chthonobacter albigriseus]
MAPSIPRSCDVAVIGAGPAGLAAAAELKARGVASVIVLDREAGPGGIPRHCDHYPFGLREFRRLLKGPAYAARLVGRAEAAGVDIRAGVTVTALRPGPVLEVSTADGLVEIAARAVLLATGVRETSRAARLIGGTKPGGVMPTGALQGLVHLDAIKPFDKPVVLGTELVSFSALLTCRHAGIRPVAMIEPGPRATARWPASLLPRLMGIPLLTGTEVAAIEGDGWVEAVTIREPGGTTRRIPTDGVVVTGRFVPEASLLRTSHLELDAGTGGPSIDQFGRCSDPAYFAAGNLLRPVETAGWSWNEGRLVGRAMADALAGRLPSSGGGVRVVVAGKPLKYVLPQRIVANGAPGSHACFQLRVSEAAAGRLALRLDGAELWGRRLSSLPERRITVPLDVLGAWSTGLAEFVVGKRSA